MKEKHGNELISDVKLITKQRRIQDFHLGGALLGVLMLSRAISALFLSILIQNGIKQANIICD